MPMIIKDVIVNRDMKVLKHSTFFSILNKIWNISEFFTNLYGLSKPIFSFPYLFLCVQNSFFKFCSEFKVSMSISLLHPGP